MSRAIEYYEYTFSTKDIRMDYKWHNPKFYQFMDTLKQIAKSKGLIFSTLNKEASINGGKRLPKGLSHLLSEFDPYPYINGASCLNNLRIDFNECSHINNMIYDKVKCENLITEDILISIAGTIGRLGFFDTSYIDLDPEVIDKIKFSENLALLRKKPDSIIIAKNLLYNLNCPLCQVQFERIYGGSEQYKLSLSLLKDTIIVYPKDKRDQNQLVDNVSKLFEKSIQSEQKYEEELIKIEKTIRKYLPIDIPDESQNIYFMQFMPDGNRLDYNGNHPFLKKLRENIKKMNYKPMKELVKPQKDGKTNYQDYYCIIDLVDCIDEQTGELVNTKEMPVLGSQSVVCRKEELLISGLQPQKGKILIVDESTEGCIASSEFFPFKVTSNIKKQITKLKNEWTANSELHYENSAIWFNNQIQKYLWDNWKDELKKKGFNWQKFLRLMRYRTDTALFWIDNRISWEDFVKKIRDDIDGDLGDMIVRRR